MIWIYRIIKFLEGSLKSHFSDKLKRDLHNAAQNFVYKKSRDSSAIYQFNKFSSTTQFKQPNRFKDEIYRTLRICVLHYCCCIGTSCSARSIRRTTKTQENRTKARKNSNCWTSSQIVDFVEQEINGNN